jgi:parvulin-like peptidyl-prolyl isomerase
VKRSFFVLIVAALALAAGGCGSTTSYAAKVNGTVISQSEIDHELEAIKNNQGYVDAIEQGGQTKVLGKSKETFNSDFVAQLVNQRVLLTVVHQELVKRKLTVDAAARQEAQSQVEQGFTDPTGQSLLAKFPKSYRDALITRTAEVNVLQNAVGNVKTDDAAVQQFYDENKDTFAETCVRHILVDSKAKADAIRAQLVSGGDFAALAKAQSIDTGSAPQGGDLGCDISQFVQEFQQAATSLPLNEISQPVQTQFGFHLIQVTKRDTRPLDDTLKGQIRQQLQQQGGSQLQEVVFTDLAKAKVSINPRIGKFDKGDLAKQQAPRVVPNAAPATSTTLPGGSQPGTGQDQGTPPASSAP